MKQYALWADVAEVELKRNFFS